MNLLTLENVSKQYSERLLLDHVNLMINEGDRIGLIGVNGSGKSTLLRLIAGEEEPDTGSVTVWSHRRVEYLHQDPQLDESATVLDQLFRSDSPQMQLLRDYEWTAAQIQKDPHDAALQARLAELSAEMDRTGGWAAEANAKGILTRLGIENFEAGVATLFDAAGDDSYHSGVHGVGAANISYHPDAGGNFAFAIDYGGLDQYPGDLQNNTVTERGVTKTNRDAFGYGFVIDRAGLPTADELRR